MKDTMRSKLTQLVRRLEEIDQNLQDPDVTSNMDQFRALSKAVSYTHLTLPTILLV